MVISSPSSSPVLSFRNRAMIFSTESTGRDWRIANAPGHGKSIPKLKNTAGRYAVCMGVRTLRDPGRSREAVGLSPPDVPSP